MKSQALIAPASRSSAVLFLVAFLANLAAQAHEAVMPVVIPGSTAAGKCRGLLEQEGVGQVVAVAAREAGATANQAEALKAKARTFATRPPVAQDIVTRDGACSGLVTVSVDDERIAREISQDLRCTRPVAVLVRMDNDASQDRLATAEWAQAEFVRSLSDSGLDIIDVSELSPDFRNLQVRSYCPWSGDHTKCAPNQASFTETVLDLLKSVRASAAKAVKGDRNFGPAQKLLKLFPGGVLLTAEFRTERTRQGVTVVMDTYAWNVETSDMAWSIVAPSASGRLGSDTPQKLLLDLVSELGRATSGDIARQCVKN